VSDRFSAGVPRPWRLRSLLAVIWHRLARFLPRVNEREDFQEAARRAVAEAETRWDFALASAGQGMWDADLKNGRTVYSSTWKRMLGYDEHELDGASDHWLSLVHPDDRQRVAAADEAYLAGKMELFEEEFRMRHKLGHWVWILDRGKIVERDENGRPIRAIGTLTDITMRREAEDRLLSYAGLLAEEKERLRVTLEAIGDAVICVDADLTITFMNPAAEKLTGCPATEAVGHPLEEIYAPVDEESGKRVSTATALKSLRQRIEHDNRVILRKKDGTNCAIREVVSPIRTAKGELSGAVIVFQDFTDARALQRRLAYAASHDSLTGLGNRASLLADLAKVAAAPEGKAGENLFLYIDLDNFKTVNDTSGHIAGDRLLAKIAKVIRAELCQKDVAARLGGDEFAIILRDCSLRRGVARAEKLARSIAGLAVNGDGSRALGASIGLTRIEAGEATEEIISRADAACYQAKAEGRGRVVIRGRQTALPRTFARAS
jgi:diguanylate cyclase (GGDEF)-like protein/PAS domain S-box-containing protein